MDTAWWSWRMVQGDGGGGDGGDGGGGGAGDGGEPGSDPGSGAGGGGDPGAGASSADIGAASTAAAAGLGVGDLGGLSTGGMQGTGLGTVGSVSQGSGDPLGLGPSGAGGIPATTPANDFQFGTQVGNIPFNVNPDTLSGAAPATVGPAGAGTDPVSTDPAVLSAAGLGNVPGFPLGVGTGTPAAGAGGGAPGAGLGAGTGDAPADNTPLTATPVSTVPGSAAPGGTASVPGGLPASANDPFGLEQGGIVPGIGSWPGDFFSPNFTGTSITNAPPLTGSTDTGVAGQGMAPGDLGPFPGADPGVIQTGGGPITADTGGGAATTPAGGGGLDLNNLTIDFGGPSSPPNLGSTAGAGGDAVGGAAGGGGGGSVGQRLFGATGATGGIELSDGTVVPAGTLNEAVFALTTYGDSANPTPQQISAWQTLQQNMLQSVVPQLEAQGLTPSSPAWMAAVAQINQQAAMQVLSGQQLSAPAPDFFPNSTSRPTPDFFPNSSARPAPDFFPNSGTGDAANPPINTRPTPDFFPNTNARPAPDFFPNSGAPPTNVTDFWQWPPP